MLIQKSIHLKIIHVNIPLSIAICTGVLVKNYENCEHYGKQLTEIFPKFVSSQSLMRYLHVLVP